MHMNIIYHCRGGTHSSPTAAALHLGILSMDRVPDSRTLMNYVPDFDLTDRRAFGHLRFMGIDEFGHKIFCMGRRKAAHIVIPAVKDALRIAGADPDEFVFINVMPTVNVWMKVGGFSSRALRLVSFGRPLVVLGTQKAFPEIAQIVKRTKSALRMGRIPLETPEQRVIE